MKYPKYAEIEGKKYKINTSYQVGIKCFEVINDPNICNEERTLAVLYLLFGDVPQEKEAAFLKIAEKYLTCGKENCENSKNRDIDFKADEPYIMASFMSDYHIDLKDVDDMHWWQFCELIGGLTEKSVLSRIREIRNYDLSEIKDEKTRRKIIDAKNAVALPEIHTAEEERAIDEFEQLFE